MFDIDKNKDLLNKIKANYEAQLVTNNKLYLYYLGITDTSADCSSLCISGSFDDICIDESNVDCDSVGNYNYINDRYNKKINTNFLKKFVKEEVSFSIGNDATYTSHSGDTKIIDTLKLNTAHWKSDHDEVLLKNMLIYGKTYELYYLDKQKRFCSKIISPRHGIAYVDEWGDIVLFIHLYHKPYDVKKQYLDIYTDTEIIHCDDTFTEIIDPISNVSRTPNFFKVVPVGIASISVEGWLDTLYHDIKSLQDAYETNLSDISGEITEFREAYLAINNLTLDKDKLADMKKNGIIQTTGKDGTIGWLVKNINDAFVQNTLTTLEDKIYQLSCHINANEKLSSNSSSLALKARLISLIEKCKLNEKSLENCIKTRDEILFVYLNGLKNTDFDCRDIHVKFTPNVPSDDLMMAQIIAQLGDKISTETALGLFSFITNPQNEIKKIESEQKPNSVGAELLNPKPTVPPTGE